MKFFRKCVALVWLFSMGVPLCAAEIHQVIQEGDSKKAKQLILANPGLLTSIDDSDRTPLHLAARFADADLVRFLIKHGADLNARSYNDFTPLHVCTKAETAAVLVHAGADTTFIDSWGNTALQMQATSRKDIAEAMIKAGAIVDLITATQLDKTELAKQIVIRNPDLLKPQKKRRKALHANESALGVAATNGNLELVKLYLFLGADVNDAVYYPMSGGTFTPLSNAAFGGHKEVVKYLLSQGS